MEPVLAVDKRPSRASRLRTMFLSGTAHPKTAGIAVTSEPPIAFAGPKVLICRRRSTGSTPPASPLRAIQTAFHKIKNKRRKASDTASQQPQQQLPPLSMPTPPVETLSNTTEPLSDRPVQEQDLEAAPHHNEDNNNDDEHTKPEIPEPQNDSPAVSISPGMRGGFALPHDCPTIIEGEEWGSGECSDPEEIAPNPNRYTHAASTAHVPTAAASSADILQAATAHMQVPVRDVAVLQSCTPVAGEQHSCSGRRADWNWQTALTAPWQASKNKLSQLSRPFFDSTSQVLQRDLNGTYKQAIQTATHGPAEALPAPPEGTPLSERRGDAPGQAKQRNPAAGHPRNPLGTQSSGQEQGPKERERSSVGSTSVIASFMERVVSVLEGSAALLSSCGTADMIDESQLVVSSGRVARSRHALPSSQSNSTTVIQSKAAPSLQVHRQQQPREMLEEGDLPDFHLVPADAKPTDAEKEQNQRCKSGEEAEWGDKSSGGKQRNKGRENEEKADKLPHFSEEPSGGNKQEDKEVSHCDTPSGSCLTKEQNVNGSLRSLYSSRWPKVSDRGPLSMQARMPSVSVNEIKKLGGPPGAAVVRVCGSYITACTSEGARVHIQHFESNKAEIVNIMHCSAAYAGVDKIIHSKDNKKCGQQMPREIQAHNAALSACLDTATKSKQINRVLGTCSEKQRPLENGGAHEPLRVMPTTPENQEKEALSPPVESHTTNGNSSLNGHPVERTPKEHAAYKYTFSII